MSGKNFDDLVRETNPKSTFEDLVQENTQKRYAQDVKNVNPAYINSFIADADDFFTSAKNDLNNITYKSSRDLSAQDKRYTTASDLKNRSNLIKYYLENNKGKIDEATYNSLVGALDSYNTGFADVDAAFGDANKYFSQWATEDKYVKESPMADKERQDRYESNQKKIDELTYNGLLEDFFLSDTDKATVAKLRQENKDYELGQGGYAFSKIVDEYNKVAQNADFGTVSANRAENPTKEDIAMFDAMNDSRTWYYDKDGVPRDSFGNELATDASGNLYNPKAQQSPVTDRLGLYLSATKDEVKDYMETLSSNTWTSVINDALDGSWDYLTDTDIGVYYYILNKEGQAAADKYLDDMKLELNRRETMSDQQRWTEKYNNSNWLQKIGMNAETLPAKFLSGTAGFVDNTVKALTGNEINPYDAVHSGTYFTNTVRGETAKELDKTGFKIPGVNFTLGDIYQTGMSRLDSALATAIFGGGGTAFLGMQAAEQEALKLYEQGASDTQITLGALSAGLAETIFEYASFGELQKLKNASKGEIEGWAKHALKNAWSQGVDEAREETLTGLTNLVTNALIMGKDSDLAEMYKENKDEAFGLFKDLLQQTAHDAFGGFIGGAGAGGTQTAGQYLQNYKQIQNAKKFGNAQQTQQAAQNRLEALGETDGAKAVAEAIAKQVSGEELSVADELLINGSKYGNQVMQETAPVIEKPVPESVAPKAKSVNSRINELRKKMGQISEKAWELDKKTDRTAGETVEMQQLYKQVDEIGLEIYDTLDKASPWAIYNKREGKRGWGKVYSTAQEALNVAVRKVNSELWDAVDKETQNAVDAKIADTPMLNALIAVQEDVRQEAITPMQGARLLSEAYETGGEKALRSLYNSSTGNLYSNYLEKAKQYESNALVKQNVETKAQGSTLPETAVGAMKSRFEHEVKRSKLYDNTFKNAASEEVREIGKKAELFDENVANYEKLTNAESMMEAKLRTRSTEEIDFEYEDLINKDGWGASDNDTAWLILDYLSKNKDYAKFVKLANKQREQATRAGQLTQSFRKYKMSPVEAAAQAAVELSQMEQQNVPKKFWKKQGFEQWKQDVGKTIMEMQQEIDGIEDGDVSSMRKTIESLAKFRKTTAWYGMSSKLAKVAQKALAKVDFQTAKDIAAAQLSKIPNDFARRSVGQVVKTIKIQNMLSALTTINRNLIGNASIGIMDATSDSTVARALDALMSKATGKRTVGNDVRYAKEYFSAAKKSAEMGALCAELDIPMDSESRFSTGSTRTFSPQGGPVTRFLSGYEKYMKYSLEVTDKFFEGGAESAVEKSLRALGEKSNLTEEEIAAISESVGERRTFKEKRALYNAAKKVKSGLNEIGGENLGLGDLVIPFAGTGSNVTQAAIDYTSFGLGGFKQMLDVMNKARKGQPVDVVEQRRAVANAARGLTGTTLVAAFTALAVMGALKVHDDDDKDKRGLLQSENLSGAQLNISAAIRAISGESADWQKDDWVISVDFLEPFNAQMYVGYLLAQEESATEALKSYPKNAFASVAQSVLDMPMMQGLSDVVDLADSIGSSIIAGDEDALENAFGQALGNQASGFVPSWMRQTAQFIDPYYRDTTGDGALEKAVNQFVASVPFASKTLPKKYSGLGEEQLRYENAAIGFFNTFINPGDIDQIKPSEITKYLNQLSERTGKNTMYPSATAPNSFTYKDENGDTVEFKISGKADTEKYQKTYGQTISSVYSDLISNEYFKSLDDKTQLDIFRLAEDYAKEKAKDAVSGYGSFPKYITEKPESMSIVEAILRNKLVGSLERFEDKSVQEAARLVSLIDEAIDGLTPQSGYERVRTVQKVEAITAADDLLTAQEQADALRDVLSDGFAERYDKVIAMGYDNDDFAKVYSIYTQDQDSKDIDKDDALKMIMRELNITKSQARKLYDAYTAPKDKSK